MELPRARTLDYGTSPSRHRRLVFAIVSACAIVSPLLWQGAQYLRIAWSQRAVREEIRWQIQRNLDEATSFISNSDFMQAQLGVDRARVAANANPAVFQTWELRHFKRQIDAVELRMGEMEDKWRQARPEAARPVRQGCYCEARDVIGKLEATAALLLLRGQFEESIETIDQVLVLDPNATEMTLLRPVAACANMVRKSLRLQPRL